MNKKKTRLNLALSAAAVITLGANLALAGEVTGNGKSLKNDDGKIGRAHV